MAKKSILSILTIFAFTALALAQQSILVLNSSTKTVAQLNATTGAVLNASFIDLTSLSVGTIKGVTQVDNKIWISDQTQDRIYIYTLAGVYESTIPNTGLDNLRGLNVVGADVVEVSPPVDPSGATAFLGATVMFELLCVLAECVAGQKA